MKYAGAGIIFICSLLFGYFLSERSKTALQTSEEIYRIMLFVRDEICVNRTPTNIILSRIQGCDAAVGLYKSFEDKLSKFLKDSDERLTDLRRKTDSKRGGRGSRRSG